MTESRRPVNARHNIATLPHSRSCTGPGRCGSHFHPQPIVMTHASRALVRGLTAISIALVASSCSGSDGPAGPAGPQGADGTPGIQGPQGPQGNANAWVYEYGAHNFATNARWDARFDDLSEEEGYNSAWLVYLLGNGGLAYHVPGHGNNGISQYRVVHSWYDGTGPSLEEPFFMISVQLLAGQSGEAYTGVRVIRIAATPASPSVSPGIGALPAGLDPNDYEAVVEYARSSWESSGTY